MLAALAVCLALLSGICLYRAFGDPLAANLTIGGLAAGGMTPVEAHRLLKQELENSLYQQSLTLQLPEDALVLTPDLCKPRVNTGRLLYDARHLPESSGELSLRPYLRADEGAIRSTLEAYAAQYDTQLSSPEWHLEGEPRNLSTRDFDPDASGQTLVVQVGTPSLHLDVDAVVDEILNAYANAINLCRDNRYRISPKVSPEAIPGTPDAFAIGQELEILPVNDTVDRNSVSFVHGSYGMAVDEALLAQEILKAEYGGTVCVPIQYLPPEVLGEEAYFQDILGAFETRHTNDKNRNTNLQLQCDALDGLVLQPGETFSMNACLGERTTERGYLPAPAYSGNRLVSSPGGGVCQGTTTLYNCVLLADLEVVFRVCHGVKVGYVPLGLDAAVNWLTTDFQFRNNFQFPIRLRAWLEGGYMKMQIWGTDEKDYYIKMETGTGEDEYAFYARSYKCKYDKETHELISRDVEAYSTYYKDIG